MQANSTSILGPRSEVQPDSALLIDPDFGGRTRNNPGFYTVEAPELVVEISDSTLQVDLNAKKQAYEEAGALEYIVFDIPKRKFHWFALRDGKFEPLAIGPDGLYRSRAFPGLWVDEAAHVQNDGRAVMAVSRRGPGRAPSMPSSSSNCGSTAQTGLDGDDGAIRMVVSPMEEGRPARPAPETRS